MISSIPFVYWVTTWSLYLYIYGAGETCTYEMDTTDLLYIEQCSEDYTNRMHFKSVERGHCWQTGPSLADTIRVLFLRKNLVNSTNKDGQSVFHTPKIFRLILCTVFLLSTSDTFEERKISPYIRITPYYWRKMKDGFFRGKNIHCVPRK